nr:hypothetical protein [Tanacetum cinerariifolium]
MSSDSLATITYTSMSSYEVIINGYYGTPMDPLDPYVQLDDADDEDEEESSDSEEEEEVHLALTVPAPALYSSVSASKETEPFEEGETAATPPPFRYRVAARISVQPHVLMPFRSESEVKRLLAIPTPPLSSVSPTSYPLPPFLMPLPIFTPLPTLSFPLPSSIPSTSGRLRRERRYFRTLATTYAQKDAHSRDYCARIMDYYQSREVHTRTLVTQIEALQRDKMAPKRARTTRANPDPTRTTTATEPMTQEAINNLIAQRVAEAIAEYETQRNSVVNGDTSNTTGT